MGNLKLASRDRAAIREDDEPFVAADPARVQR